MSTTEIEIVDYEIRPDTLAVTVGFPAFEYLRTTRYRRNGDGLPDGINKAWYCNDTQGSLPTKQELLAETLNRLVLQHPILSRLASEYQIAA